MATLSLTLTKTSNVLVDKNCYEPVDLNVLEKLMNSDLLINNFKNPITRDMIGCEKKQLQKYKSLTNRETNRANVKYIRPKGMSFGRSNPNGAIGLFCMRRKIRHTLANVKKLTDIDIINAHPDMLLQICKSNGLVCDKLEFCGIWGCRLDDFMCPRYEWNKKYNLTGWSYKDVLPYFKKSEKQQDLNKSSEYHSFTGKWKI
jgi:hypothetical protein